MGQITNKFLYLTGSSYPPSNYLLLQDKALYGNNPNNAATTTIYTVAKVASGSYWQMSGSTTMTVAANTSLRPVGNPSAVFGDCWVAGPFNGVFLPGTWSLQFGVQLNNASSAGFNRFRVLKGSDLSGSNAQPICFPSVLNTQTASGAINTFLTASAVVLTSSTVFANEYLFIQAAWAITAAGGANSATVTVMAPALSTLSSSQWEETSFTIWSDDLNPGYVG